MAWTPTRAVITARAIPDNLLTWVTDDTRQSDALLWAGANLKPLKSIQQRRSERNTPFYPVIAFRDDNDPQVFDDDINTCDYSVTFETQVQHADGLQATANARIYDKALKSLIANCPMSTLLVGTGAVTAVVLGIETGFLPLQAGQEGNAKNDFLQRFQTQIAIRLVGSAHS